MADYQRVVEFLRDFRSAPVQQGSGEISEELRQAAAEYAELCAQANDRLRQCSTFLQQGLRSEAIHLADGGGGEAPNLLDLVAALDLPDAAQWVEFCQNNGLPVPVTLQMERAGQLDGAYSAEQPLEHLLSRHRLLALSRGPVRERLNVMRQLAAQDPAGANSFWEKDLRVFERARLRELPAAFYAAVKSRDFQTITALQTELSQYPWYEAIPDDLRQAVGTAYDRMHRSEVEGSIKEIINRLHDAFAARNQGDCAALMAQIKDTLTANNLKDLSGELREEVKPIRDWLASENELASKHKSFMAACGDFTRRMDADAPDHELEAAHAKLNSFEEPVPEELERRYEEKLRGRHEAAQRSLRIKLFSVIGSLAAVVVVVGLILWVVSNNASASKWISGIKQANADRNLTYAHQLIQAQEARFPKLNDNDELRIAKQETAALQSEFERDSESMKTALGALDQAIGEATKVSNAADATVAGLLNAAGSLDDPLTRSASESFRWVDAGGKLALARTSAENLRGQLRQKASGLVTTAVDGLTQELANAQTPEALTALSSKAGDLRNAGLDDAAKNALTGLLTKVDQARGATETANTQAAELKALAGRATSADKLKDALDAYTKRFPTAPATPELTQALGVIPGAKAIEGWENMAADWGNQAVPTTGAGAQKRLDAIQAYLAAYPGSPLTYQANLYSEFLKSVNDALADKGAWQTAFADILANPLFTDLAYVESSAGARYYILGDWKRKDRSLNDRVSITFESLDPKNLTKRVNVSIDPPVKLLTDKPVAVAHTKLAAEMIQSIKTIDEGNWDTYGIDLAARLVKADEMDIVVRSILLQQALKTTSQVDNWGGAGIGDIYEKTLVSLNRQALDQQTWYDPGHPVPEATRVALKNIMKGMPRAEDVKALLAKKRDGLGRSSLFKVVGTGIILKDSGGNAAISLATGGVGNGVVYALGQPVATVVAAVTPAPAAAAATPAPATAPADGAAAAESQPAAPPAAGVPAAAPAAAGAAVAMSPLLHVADYKDGRCVVIERAIKDLPQGTMVFVTEP